MELEQLQNSGQMPRYSNYDLSVGATSTKWYLNKKTYIWLTIIGLVLFISAALFVGGYFTGLSTFVNGGHTISLPIVTEIEWDGACPRREEKCPESYDGIPPVLLVSLDGFRPDYLKRQLTPTLSNLSECGTSAPFMYPVFPSKTFPNHYSIVTGLNPASHGIIDNNMYDPVKRKLYKIGNSEFLKPYWYEREPIWVTAHNQNKRSSVYFWPGSEVLINGVRPDDYIPYKSSIPFGERVDTIFNWLDRPKAARPDFLTLYVNQPDKAGHANGIGSRQVNDALVEVDKMMTKLISGLQQRKLLNCINIIIVSDHGMVDTSCSRTIGLNDYLNISETYTTIGAFGRIRMKNASATDKTISDLQCQNEHMRVYPKQQLPVRFHYVNNKRIEPIYVDLDAGWSIFNYKPGPKFKCLLGNHGYDNYFDDMQALFMAYGPSFKLNNTVEPFINTELYELMCELLNITANSNNGTLGSLHHLLVDPKSLDEQEKPPRPIIATVAKMESEYNIRLNGVNCTCEQNVSVQQDVEDTTDLDIRHMPFGMPFSLLDDTVYNTTRILYNKDYVESFDFKLRIPIWSSFTLSLPMKELDVNPPCWRGDARMPLDGSSVCSSYNDSRLITNGILQKPLFPHAFANTSNLEEASLVTNSVPKYENHLVFIEKWFYNKILLWLERRKSINIVTGPAFDYNADGILPDIATIMKDRGEYNGLVVPTHYFYILTWCQEKTLPVAKCNSKELDVMAFLLPNIPIAYNCESPDSLINKHAARVADIEILTGISFFTELHIYDTIRLRTKIPRL